MKHGEASTILDEPSELSERLLPGEAKSGWYVIEINAKCLVKIHCVNAQ